MAAQRDFLAQVQYELFKLHSLCLQCLVWSQLTVWAERASISLHAFLWLAPKCLFSTACPSLDCVRWLYQQRPWSQAGPYSAKGCTQGLVVPQWELHCSDFPEKTQPQSSEYQYLPETSWLPSMRTEFQLLAIILRLLFLLQKRFLNAEWAFKIFKQVTA